MELKYWNQRWSNETVNTGKTLQKQNPQRFEILKKVCKRHFGESPFRTLEIGCGLGVNTLLLSLEFPKASCTLIDFSESALKQARKLHKSFGRQPQTVLANVFEYSPKEKFDLVMSFGVAEHFIGKMRKEIIQRHFALARPGAAVFLSVPNQSCLLYRLDMFLLNHLRRFKKLYRKCSQSKADDFDIEVAFSKKELKELARDLAVSNLQVQALSFSQAVEDFLRFGRYPLQRLGFKTASQIVHWPRIKLPLIDHWMGQMLVLTGERTKNGMR